MTDIYIYNVGYSDLLWFISLPSPHSTIKGIIENHYPRWESGRLGGEWRTWIPTMTRKAMNSLDIFWFSESHFFKTWVVEGLSRKICSFFGLSSLFEMVQNRNPSIRNQQTEKPERNPSENPSGCWQVQRDATNRNDRPGKSVDSEKTGSDSMCMLEINQEYSMWAEDIRGWSWMILYDFMIFMMYSWLIEWSFAVTGGAEYCRVPVSIQWNDMWRKHEDTLEHDATYTSLLSFARKFESIMLLPFEKNMTY